MNVVSSQGKEDLAMVHIGMMRGEDARFGVEFVESLQPPHPRDEKWVLIVSSLFGCPVKCRMCDAGSEYNGCLEAHEILEQIDYMVRKRYPDRRVPVSKFKVQFARMGEPAYNPNVLSVLRVLPDIYDAPGLMPCISTVAPAKSAAFLDELIYLKDTYYRNGRFQMQFSIHTTDDAKRDELMPVKKLTLGEIAEYGARFWKPGDRKLTLNFALADGYPLDIGAVEGTFSPEKFLIKLTPVNPTHNAASNGLRTVIDPDMPGSGEDIAESFRAKGFETILSIGEAEENRIGSNCGMYVGAGRV